MGDAEKMEKGDQKGQGEDSEHTARAPTNREAQASDGKGVAGDACGRADNGVSQNYGDVEKTIENGIQPKSLVSGDSGIVSSSQARVDCRFGSGDVEESDIKQFLQSFDVPDLPDATAGKFYEAAVCARPAADDIGRLLNAGLTLSFPLLDNVGLSFDAERLVVKGTPSLSGVQKFQIEFSYSDGPLNLHIKRDYELVIRPDPRSLWKEIEPDPALPYPKSNTDSRRQVQDGMLLIGASRRGRSHAHKGTHRDDDFTMGPVGDGWMIIAVADGAGSARFSRRGSQILCEEIQLHIGAAVGECLSEGFEQSVVLHHEGKHNEHIDVIKRALYNVFIPVVHRAVKVIAAEAEEQGANLKDYATTLVLTLSKRFSFGWFVACFAIGDGGAGVIVGPGSQDVRILNRQDGGEFSGQTQFATMSEIWKNSNELSQRIRFITTNEMVALIAMTDGVSDAHFSTERDFEDPDKWVKFWGGIQSEVDFRQGNEAADEELLEWLGFWADGEHDDRTIAVAIPGPGRPHV